MPVRSQSLNEITRIVVKLGTGVVTDNRKQPDLAQMEQLVTQAAEQRKAGKEIVLVSSGAVGAGMGVLGFERRPNDLAELQACAAVGQSRLMAIYEQLFARFDLRVAQVLLTHDDLQHHERHLNARNTLVTLLAHGVVPIINENDAISFTELKFGDNDKLSALVASLLPADLLVILTTVDGVIENFGKANPKTINTIEQIDKALEGLAGIGGGLCPPAVRPAGRQWRLPSAHLVTCSHRDRRHTASAPLPDMPRDAECVVIRRNQKLGRLFQIRSQPQCVFRSKQFPNRPQELARFIASKVSDVRTEKQCNGWSVTVRRHTLGQRLKSRKIIRSESGDPKPGI